MLAAVVLAGLVLAAGLSAPYGVRGAALLAGVSVLWLVVNGPMEGLVLWTVSEDHGVTGRDLAGFTGLALAGYRAYRVVRSRPREPGRR
jgi:hypothetical protein